MGLHIQHIETDGRSRSNQNIRAFRTNDNALVSVSDCSNLRFDCRGIDNNVIELDIPCGVVYIDKDRRRASDCIQAKS